MRQLMQSVTERWRMFNARESVEALARAWVKVQRSKNVKAHFDNVGCNLFANGVTARIGLEPAVLHAWNAFAESDMERVPDELLTVKGVPFFTAKKRAPARMKVKLLRLLYFAQKSRMRALERKANASTSREKTPKVRKSTPAPKRKKRKTNKSSSSETDETLSHPSFQRRRTTEELMIPGSDGAARSFLTMNVVEQKKALRDMKLHGNSKRKSVPIVSAKSVPIVSAKSVPVVSAKSGVAVSAKSI
jgi:hypothetical protein